MSGNPCHEAEHIAHVGLAETLPERNCHQLGRVPTGGEGSGAQVAGQMLQPIVCQIHQYNGSTMGYGLLPSPVLCKRTHSNDLLII